MFLTCSCSTHGRVSHGLVFHTCFCSTHTRVPHRLALHTCSCCSIGLLMFHAYSCSTLDRVPRMLDCSCCTHRLLVLHACACCTHIRVPLMLLFQTCSQGRQNHPRNPRRGGARPGQEPRPEHRGDFLLENDFNACYNATLICLYSCVWKSADGGGGLKNVGLQLRRSRLKCGPLYTVRKIA